MRRVALVGVLVSAVAGAQPVTLQAPYGLSRAEAARLLAIHNRERAAFGSIPMIWDPHLEAQAQSYAHYLTGVGRLVHAPKAQRPGQGENLAYGQGRAWSVDQLAGTWIAERRNFRAGVFPYVSTTGNWAHSGHYSQLVWPSSTRLGCGIARGRGATFLVCRYSPPGNRDGVRIG